MPYASKGKISLDPIEDGIEITAQQYAEALEALQAGLVVDIDHGRLVLAPPHQEVPAQPERPEAPQGPQTIFATRDYLKRFSMAEYAAARRAENIEVQWALDNMIAAQYIDIEDPETAAGLDLMVAEGIISADKRDELLRPVAVMG